MPKRSKGLETISEPPRRIPHREDRTLRLALCQIDTTQADPFGNLDRILDVVKEAARGGAEIALLPELALAGYCPGDLLFRRSFHSALRRAEEKLIANMPEGIVAMVGNARWVTEGTGKSVVNEAIVVERGRLIVRRAKSCLPTYDVFDEARYFRPADRREPILIGGRNLGVTICEDAWTDQGHDLAIPDYENEPPHELREQGADAIFNLSASPFGRGRGEIREKLIAGLAGNLGLPLALVNLVGGNDEVLFDGRSFLADRNGVVRHRLAAFTEDFAIVDLEDKTSEPTSVFVEEPEETRQALVMGIRAYARKTGFKSALVGLSGGIDSALVAVLAAEALGPKAVHAVAMPSEHSAAMSKDDAEVLADRLGISFSTIPIAETFASLRRDIEPVVGSSPKGLTLENLQPRIRGTLLMALSNESGALLLSTGNKSELAVGYCTLYGDMCGGLAVLSDLSKTRAYALARHINAQGAEVIPSRIIDRPPSAELRPDQKDSDSLPDYAVLDDILERFEEGGEGEDDIVAAGHPRATVREILDLIWKNEYKRRQMPPGLRITNRAYGSGRRMPLTAPSFRPSSEATEENDAS